MLKVQLLRVTLTVVPSTTAFVLNVPKAQYSTFSVVASSLTLAASPLTKMMVHVLHAILDTLSKENLVSSQKSKMEEILSARLSFKILMFVCNAATDTSLMVLDYVKKSILSATLITA